MIVDTATGKLQGAQEAGVRHFRGIPYARADRFKPPEPVTPWAGTRDATRFGPVAPQNLSPTDVLLGLEPGTADEACLVLNVTTPATDDRRRPVLVWIHGGGFTGGSGHAPHYHAANLVRAADGEIVVVTLNYRLGALGFLHLDNLLPEYAGSALNGLRDQVAALRWVQTNIAAFGGDPDRVTIFGESAGGMSVATLLAVPAATGLFRGAIAQSGAAERLLRPDAAAWVAERLLELVDLRPAQAAELLRLPAEKMVAAQAQIEAELFTHPPAPGSPGPAYLHLPFQPVIDGRYLPEPPLDAVRRGDTGGVALVTGTTRDEWRLFMFDELRRDLEETRLRQRVTRLTGPDRADEAIALYRHLRPDDTNTDIWGAMLTDVVFRLPAIHLAESQAAHTEQVAMYRFDYPSAAFDGLPGACHAIDVPFVFDNVHLPGIAMLLGGVDDDTRGLARGCARGWASMAIHGSPAHDGLPWPRYDATRRATCILHRDLDVKDDPDRETRLFWDRTTPGSPIDPT